MNTNGTTFRKSLFAIEDGPVYVGYTNGEHWNGWARPFFTRKVAEQLMRDVDEGKSRYDEDSDTFLLDIGQDDADVMQSQWIPALGRNLYDGSMGWIWTEVALDKHGKRISSGSTVTAHGSAYTVCHFMTVIDQRWDDEKGLVTTDKPNHTYAVINNVHTGAMMKRPPKKLVCLDDDSTDA